MRRGPLTPRKTLERPGGGPFVFPGTGRAYSAGVRRHSPLLGGILVLAACGSSAASTIDTHNAKRLEVSRISPDALASAPEPRTEGGSVVWTAPDRKWAIRLEKTHPIRLVSVPAG